jgi:hypothetical protein
MKEVNLEEILSSELSPNYPQFDLLIGDTCSCERALLAMREACKQVLELAVEKMKLDAIETFGTDIPDCWDELSILNTIEQVK